MKISYFVRAGNLGFKIADLREEQNLQHLLVAASFPVLAQEKIMGSLKRLNEEMLPRYRTSREPAAAAH